MWNKSFLLFKRRERELLRIHYQESRDFTWYLSFYQNLFAEISTKLKSQFCLVFFIELVDKNNLEI